MPLQDVDNESLRLRNISHVYLRLEHHFSPKKCLQDKINWKSYSKSEDQAAVQDTKVVEEDTHGRRFPAAQV